MGKMILKTIAGELFRLTDYTSVERYREVNGSFTFSFYLLKTERNEHAYEDVINENSIIYDGVEYVIKNIKSKMAGRAARRPGKQIECELKTQEELINEYQYKTISGAIRINAAMAHALEPLPHFDFIVYGDFPKSVTFENFGNENPLALLNKIADRYGAEFAFLSATTIGVYNRIGTDTNSQFRYRHNIGTISIDTSTEGFATYIRGFGDPELGIEAEYESPLAKIYGRIHADPVEDERFKYVDTLREECKNRLNDAFSIAIEVDYVDVKKNGKNVNPFDLGDSLYLIHGPLNLKDRARVLAITDYPESNKQPRLKIANMSRDARDLLAEFSATKKTVDKVTTDDGRVKNAALSADAQYTIDSVSRTFAEVDYNKQYGLKVIDGVNFMRFLSYKNGGLFGTTDEGRTMQNLINPDGVNLAHVRGRLAENHVSVGPQTTFAPGYDPSKIKVEPEPVEPIQTPTMQNNWVAFGVDWSQPGYYKDRGRVYLQGTITGGIVGTVSFTLPVGYRPTHNITINGVDVMRNGEVIIQANETGKLSLDNINFRV